MGVDITVEREILRILIGNFDKSKFEACAPISRDTPNDNYLVRAIVYNRSMFVAKEVAKVMSDYPREISFDGKLKDTLKKRYDRILDYLKN